MYNVLQYVFHLEHTDIHVNVHCTCTSVCTYSLTPWLDFLSSASGEVVFGEGARTGASDVNSFDLAFSLFKSRQLKKMKTIERMQSVCARAYTSSYTLPGRHDLLVL